MPTQSHPLAPYADRIAPGQTYTIRSVADLLELSVPSVSGMATYGLLPGSRWRPGSRGGRHQVWTGRQLLRLARKPVRAGFDHERFSPVTLYRIGCRCPVCTAAHRSASRERGRALAEQTFPEEMRRRVLDLVAAGTPVAQAAEQAGATLSRVYGRAVWDGAFAEGLDEAGWALCVLGEENPRCGTSGAYRGLEATEGRAACRGTGCREWRRDQARQERQP
ncbi:hypothetical protein [Streptomyces sp. NPDC088557]|uniref:hypothetical protein n=1 Tax=Streptomyces sp. NPDC088557 TaxID=3365867 RepID=UPI003815C732